MEKTIIKKSETSGKNIIDIENLELYFKSLIKDANKANKGNFAAARRFRVNTVDISKKFIEARACTVKQNYKS